MKPFLRLLAKAVLSSTLCLAGAAGAVVIAPTPTPTPINPNPGYVPSVCVGATLITQSPGGAPHFVSDSTSFPNGVFRPTQYDATHTLYSRDLNAWFKSFGSPRPQYRNLTGLWARLELLIGTLGAFDIRMRRDDNLYDPYASGALGLYGRTPWSSGTFDLQPYEDTSYNDYFQGTHNVCYANNANTSGRQCRVFFLRLTEQTTGTVDFSIDRDFLYWQPSPVTLYITDQIYSNPFDGTGTACSLTFFGRPDPPIVK